MSTQAATENGQKSRYRTVKKKSQVEDHMDTF